MDILDIFIDDKTYKYVNNINFDNKNYLVYTDNEQNYISEYTYEDGNLTLKEIDDETFNKVKEALNEKV